MLRILATIFLVGFALLAWQFTPVSTRSRAAPVRSSAWTLPREERVNWKLLAHNLTARNKEGASLWGAAAAVAASQLSPTNPAWRVAGVAARGADHQVLVQIEGKPVVILKNGDALPDGATIVGIGEEQVSVLINGKKQALSIK